MRVSRNSSGLPLRHRESFRYIHWQQVIWRRDSLWLPMRPGKFLRAVVACGNAAFNLMNNSACGVSMTMLEGQMLLAMVGMMLAVLASAVLGQRWANHRERVAREAEFGRDRGTASGPEIAGIFPEVSGP